MLPASDAGPPVLRARRHGHGPGLADAVQRRRRLGQAADHGAAAAARDPRLTSASSRATRASTRSSARARSSRPASDLKALPERAEGLRQAAQGRQEGPRPAREGPRPGRRRRAASCARASAAPPTARASCRRARARPAPAPASSTAASARPAPAPRRSPPACTTRSHGATALKKGSAQALAGSQKLAGGLGQAAKPVKRGPAGVQAARGDVDSRQLGGDRRARRRRGLRGQLDAALAALRLDDGRQGRPALRRGAQQRCPGGAHGSAGGVQARSRRVHPKLAGRRRRSRRRGRGQVAELSIGLSPALRRLERARRAASPSCATATPTSPAGIGKLNTGGGQLTSGLGALNDGAAALESGLGQLTGGAGQLQSGLAGGTGPGRRSSPAASAQLAGRRRQVPRRAAVAEGPRAAPEASRRACSTPATSCSRRSQGAPRADRDARLLRGQPRPRRQRRPDRGRARASAARDADDPRARRGPPGLGRSVREVQRHRGRRRRPGRQPDRLHERDQRADSRSSSPRSPLAVALVLMIGLRDGRAAARGRRVRRPDHPRDVRGDDAAVRG